MNGVTAFRPSLGSLLPVGLALLAAYWFVIASLAAQWADDPNYAHGFFVVPMVVFLAWRRRERWRAAPPAAEARGFLLVAAAGAVYLAGLLAAELFTMRVSLVLAVTAVVLTMEGSARMRVMWYPLLFLLLMIPIPYVLYYRLTFPLQLESSRLAAAILTGMGMPLVREGNMIHIEGYSLEVVAACSGLRSIMTLGTLAFFMLDFLHLAVGLRVLFIVLTIPIAVAANVGRLVLTAGIAAIQGPAAAESFLHELSGLVVFVIGMLAIVASGRGLQWIGRARTS